MSNLETDIIFIIYFLDTFIVEQIIPFLQHLEIFQNFMWFITNVEHQSQLALGWILGHQQHNFQDWCLL